MYFYVFISILLVFSLMVNNKHLLMILLILESLMLFFLFSFFFTLGFSNLFMFLVFITLSACEGALGLSILVLVTRSHGSDYLNMINSAL